MNKCNCNNIAAGSYDNQVMLDRPLHMALRTEGSTSNMICVDACLKDEILNLWSLGISTTGCCCGHNKNLPYIGVIDEDIEKMKELGYIPQFNKCRPLSYDSFHTKTSNFLDIVKNEREKQINKFGYTHEHDDEHTDGSIADAAACYATKKEIVEPVWFEGYSGLMGTFPVWPWDKEYFKIKKTRKEQIITSCALLMSEYERIIRLEEK